MTEDDRYRDLTDWQRETEEDAARIAKLEAENARLRAEVEALQQEIDTMHGFKEKR